MVVDFANLRLLPDHCYPPSVDVFKSRLDAYLNEVFPDVI